MSSPTPQRLHELARAGGLPQHAVLVRAGLSSVSNLATAALNCRESELGAYGLTFWSWPDATPEEIALRARQQALARGAKNPVPHPQMRCIVVEELLACRAAFYLRQTIRPGHYTLYLSIGGDGVTWDTEAELLSSDAGEVLTVIEQRLSRPMDNPGKGAFDA